MEMKNYLVTVTNGIEKSILIIEKDGKWVTDLESAKKMAESKINSAWSVVEAVPAFAEIVVR